MIRFWRWSRGLFRAMATGLGIGLGIAVGALNSSAQTYAAGTIVGTVSASQIGEASGLVASRQNSGVLWTHNDSGWPGTVFALATNGTLLGVYQLPNAWWGDFEDIAVGPGPSPQVQYLYLGDIGDNYSSRQDLRVYRFPEPATYHYHSNLPPTRLMADAETLILRYPDGPQNCEGMMVDPVTGDLFLATKLTNSSRIYRAARATLQSGAPVDMTFVREITSTQIPSPVRSVSAADMSADGGLITLRRSGRVDVWSRSAGQSVGAALGGNSKKGEVIGQPLEPNGEAITIDASGRGYFTLSEGYGQPLYFFRRTDAGVPALPRVFVAAGEVWHYDDSGFEPLPDWFSATYDAGDWSSGPAQLGYGEGDERTVISFGPDDFYKNMTTYFRRNFIVASTNGLTRLGLRLCYSDGVAVYLNGVEVLRQDLPPGAAYDEPAARDAGLRAYAWQSFAISPGRLRAGTNTLAVELHRFSPSGPGLSFDLQLLEARIDLPLQFTAPPERTNAVTRLSISGPVGFEAAVEKSADLVSWLPLTTVTLTTGSTVVTDPAPAADARFYRLR